MSPGLVALPPGMFSVIGTTAIALIGNCCCAIDSIAATTEAAYAGYIHTAPTLEVMRTYGHDYKLIFVGDATMSPYEIVQPGGSIEHWNEEPGALWMQRLAQTWPHHVWLNPEPENRWEHTPSVQLTRELVEDRMFPLTLHWPRGLARPVPA